MRVALASEQRLFLADAGRDLVMFGIAGHGFRCNTKDCAVCVCVCVFVARVTLVDGEKPVTLLLHFLLGEDEYEWLSRLGSTMIAYLITV